MVVGRVMLTEPHVRLSHVAHGRAVTRHYQIQNVLGSSLSLCSLRTTSLAISVGILQPDLPQSTVVQLFVMVVSNSRGRLLLNVFRISVHNS